MEDKLIKLYNKYQLTRQEGKELEEQYWMEHVIRRLVYRTNDHVFMINLGSFKLRESFLYKTIRGYKSHIKELYSERVIEDYKKKIANIKKEINEYFREDKTSFLKSNKRMVAYTGENPTDLIQYKPAFDKKTRKRNLRRKKKKGKDMLRKW